MSRYHGTCAGCGASLLGARELGSSGLYNPGGPDFELCMGCFQVEEDVTVDGNFQPDMLARYYQTFGETRPKLLDVLTGEYV